MRIIFFPPPYTLYRYQIYAFPGAGMVTATNPNPISEEIQTIEIFVDPSVSEIQTIEVSGAASGTFLLSWRNEATIAIPFNPTAQQIEDALNDLTTIGRVDVTLSTGSTFDITVRNKLFLIFFAFFFFFFLFHYFYNDSCLLVPRY